MTRRALLAAVALSVVLGACAEGDDEQGAVQAMVLETCAPGGDPAADPVCRCAYDALVERFGAEELERLDEQLQSDPAALPEEARQLVLDCAFDRIDPSPATVATVATVATTSTSTASTAADTDPDGSTSTTEAP